MSEKPSFFAELKRRHVFRVAIAYAVTAWLLLQLGSIVFPVVHAPRWCEGVLLAFLVLGFPVALLLAWAFEVTPEGVRRTVPVESEAARPEANGRRLGRRIDFVIIAVLAAAVGVLGWQRFATAPQSAAQHVAATPPGVPAAASATAVSVAATAISPKSIAVLPFENLNVDKKDAYFVAGIQDLILTKLADIGDLKVISRTSTMQYTSHPESLTRIGEQLGVATILEGSVQKAGNQVLVNVQLIDARTDNHIWAQSYQRTLENVFGVEGEVAEKIAAALKAKLSPAETTRLATALSGDPKANDLYLRAEYFMNRAANTGHVPQSLKQAIPLYRQAIARVPDFALAHARLSFAYSWLALVDSGGEDLKQLNADAYAQAEQAMKLAPDLAESHLAIGFYEFLGKGDYDTALKAFAAALKIRPNDVAAITARGLVLRRQGKFDQAIDTFKYALALNPRSTAVAETLGTTYMAISRYSEAEQALQHAIALDPGNDSARASYVWAIVLGTGDLSRALAAAQGTSVYVKSTRVEILTLQRKYSAAIALLESIPDKSITHAGFRPKNLVLGDLYRLSGNRAMACTHYAKELPLVHADIRTLAINPLKVAIRWRTIAVTDLCIGKTDAAIAAIRTSLAAGERSGDHFERPYILKIAAIFYAQAGRAKQAVSLISRALATPGTGLVYSPVMLWLDPEWDPIRKTPEFRALLKKYAKYKPTTVPTVGAAPAASTVPAS